LILFYDELQLQEILNSMFTFSLMQDSVGEAMEVLELAERSAQDSIKAQQLKISLLISQGQLQQAKQVWTEMDLSNQQQANYFLEIGNRYQLRTRVDSALIFYQRAIQLQPDYTEAIYQAALSYQRMAHQLLSLEHSRQQAEQEAARQQALGYLRKAERHLQRIQDIQPDFPLLQLSIENVQNSLDRLS